jgi:hypothetical protein
VVGGGLGKVVFEDAGLGGWGCGHVHLFVSSGQRFPLYLFSPLAVVSR